MNASKCFLSLCCSIGVALSTSLHGQTKGTIEPQAKATSEEQTFDVLFEEEIGINGELTIDNHAQKDRTGRPLSYKMMLGGVAPLRLTRQWCGTLVMLPDGTFSEEKSDIRKDAKLKVSMSALDENDPVTRFWVEYLFEGNDNAPLLSFLSFEPNLLVQALTRFQKVAARAASMPRIGAKMDDWRNYLPFCPTTDEYTFNLLNFPGQPSTWFEFEPKTKKELIKVSAPDDDQTYEVEVLKGPSPSVVIHELPWRGKAGAIILMPFSQYPDKHLELPEFNVPHFKVLYDPKREVLRAIECKLEFKQPFRDFVIPNYRRYPNPPFGIVPGKNCSFAVRCYINPVKRSKYGRKQGKRKREEA